MTQPSESELRAADGRVPGRRGRATRDRLLECTGGMLTATSYRDVKVIDIAREAGTSPATFYQYFPDVEAAILVLAEQMAHESRLAGLAHDSVWRGKAGFETALRLVDGFLDFWEENRPILRVVDLATDEGDIRFRQIRVRLLAEVTDALAEVIRHFQDEGRHPADVDSRATAGALVSMLAHVAAHRYGFEFWGIRTADLRLSMGRMIFWSVTGQKPPS